MILLICNRNFVCISLRTKNEMKHQSLNPVQLHLLQMFQGHDSEKDLDELKSVLSEYYARKVDEGMDQLWEEGKINSQTLSEWEHEHLRTPSRRK